MHNLGKIDYNKIESCAANGLSSAYCSNNSYKAGESLFFAIVSAVARKYNASSGVVDVEKVSTHTEVHKHHGTFKSKITVKYYMDSYPTYYMLVPPNTPGTVNSPTSGFTINGMGYLRVDKATALGWDWSVGTALYDEKSKSSWNGWVGIGLGILTVAVGVFVAPAIAPAIASYATIGAGVGMTVVSTYGEIKSGDFGTFHGYGNDYNKLKASLGDSSMQKISRVNSSRWANVPFGSELDGSKEVFSYIKSLKSYEHAGWNNGFSLTPEQRKKIKEMNEQ